jgi:hypothetical protein
MNATPDFISVPVPAEHVTAVYRFLAELVDGGGAPIEHTLTITTGWTDEELARLTSSPIKAVEILTAVLNVLAANPDEWMNLDEIAPLTEFERPTLKSVWTHIARHLNKHFDRASLPLESIWGLYLTPPRDAAQYYRLTSDQAAQWSRVTGA